MLPQRTCIACGAKKAPRELLRVVSRQGAAPSVDVAGRAPGRGAYVCHTAACVERAFARRAFERALKLQKAAPPELKQLKEQILAVIEKGESQS
jgi:uncharacterized protein